MISITVPALRERPEDIKETAMHFLRLSTKKHEKNITAISDAAMSILVRHAWPGNVRELSNVIERAVVLARAASIEPADLPRHIQGGHGGARTGPDAATGTVIPVPLGTPLKQVEEMLIRKTLEATDGDKSMTARLLGIHSRTICRKLDKPV